MSEDRHTEVRGPGFTGLGKRPSLQPCHHALLLMGIIVKTCGRRKKFSLQFSGRMVSPLSQSRGCCYLVFFVARPDNPPTPASSFGVRASARNMGKLSLYPVSIISKFVEHSGSRGPESMRTHLTIFKAKPKDCSKQGTFAHTPFFVL